MFEKQETKEKCRKIRFSFLHEFGTENQNKCGKMKTSDNITSIDENPDYIDSLVTSKL